VSGREFLGNEGLQTEAFGNASLFVVAESVEEVGEIIGELEGNLTGCFYTATTGEDDAAYRRLAPLLRVKVGRLLNDKMPTGVALSAGMNHGGPWPSTGHSGFSAVGIPGSMRRFGRLESFDGVRAARLPGLLQNVNPGGRAWRMVDGTFTQGDAEK
jgi:NADP-dependent aldehyde dehydrogenase